MPEEKLCVVCGKTHSFPMLKFAVGQKVKLIPSERGSNHWARVGEMTVITGVNDFLRAPCDEPEYDTEFGFGSIMEHRLEAVSH